LQVAMNRCEELKNSSNECLQICIARNLKYFRKKFPERTLDLMEFFLKDDKRKNVRRPIAKEDSVECIVSFLEDKKWMKKAEGIIWKLMTDHDDIIRLATLDKIEKILRVSRELGTEILDLVIKRNSHSKMVERARSLLARSKAQ
ncbi:unnamed protein product, partial [marine sediment metagenome]